MSRGRLGIFLRFCGVTTRAALCERIVGVRLSRNVCEFCWGWTALLYWRRDKERFSMSIGTLLIRADASVAIGTGHVMRCLALGQGWQDAGGRVVFAMAERTDAIQNRLSAESCEIATIASKAGTVEDAAQTVALASQQKCEWIVVDGYLFTAKYQADLKSADCKVLFLDDYGQAQHYSADFILN